MMQSLSQTPVKKNSLFNAMNRFLGAVNNMDRTVMVPSLLRDVPLGDDAELCEGDTDMFSYYQLLKSIRRDIEWGLKVSPVVKETPPRLTRLNSNASTASTGSTGSSSSFTSSPGSISSEDDDYEEDEDLQKQFQYHLAGLQGVLGKLTAQANSLTTRYNQSIGL
ncbi:mid1-interacting protein 1-B-like [Stigmatopora nigra]